MKETEAETRREIGREKIRCRRKGNGDAGLEKAGTEGAGEPALGSAGSRSWLLLGQQESGCRLCFLSSPVQRSEAGGESSQPGSTTD